MKILKSAREALFCPDSVKFVRGGFPENDDASTSYLMVCAHILSRHPFWAGRLGDLREEDAHADGKRGGSSGCKSGMVSRSSMVRACRAFSGFTLVELLVVIAIIGVLAAFVAPAIPSVLGAQGLTKAVNDVGSIMELARTEAMSRRTYAYVGFTNIVNSSGQAELRVSAASSPDGSTNTSGLRAIARLARFENVWMTDYAGLPQSVQNVATNATDASGYVLRMPASGVQFSNGNQSFSGAMIIFSPQGELISSPSTNVFKDHAHVGLVGMRGTTPKNNEGAVVSLDGGSGVISFIRP